MSLEQEVHAWHEATFGIPADRADEVLTAAKLIEEAGEVLGAIFKRGEGRRATRHVLDELGDVGIVLVVLAAREGYGLNELITRRFEEVRRR
jgi:NTP pyrophosphatase (non-canonical NTP hydrolase)